MSKDDTKGTPKDESTGTPKDESKGTPKDKGKLYNEAAIDKIKSDAAAMGQGRAEKAAKQEKETLTSELQSTKDRLDALEKEANEARLAEARGDPAALSAYQRDQASTKRERDVGEKERDITRREAQLKDDRAEVDKDRGVVSVAYLAAKHGLKTEDLEGLGITDPDALEKVAEKLAASKTGKSGDGEGGEGDKGGEGDADNPDSNTSDGSGELTEDQRLDERYPTMKK